MKRLSVNSGWLAALLLCLEMTPCALAQNFTVFAENLQWPLRLTFTPQGNLLVSEGGLPEENTGRVSILNRAGIQRSLLEGLPSGPAHFANPYGPTSMAVDGSTLYVLIGEGVYSGPPPQVINPDGPASPIFSSVLKVEFSADVDRLTGSFRLTQGDHWGLADGYEVNYQNAAGERARFTKLAEFRPLVRNVLGGPSRTRQSDPFGLVLDAPNHVLYFTDAGAETIVRVDTNTGKSNVLIRFPPFVRRTAQGDAYVDNVPTALCKLDEKLLVGFLTGAPFPEGEATLRSFDPRTRDNRMYVGELQRILDAVCIKGVTGPDRVYVLESNPAAANAGRLRLYEGSTGRVLTDGLPNPSGMAQDPVSGDIFLANLGQGRILRVPLQ